MNECSQQDKNMFLQSSFTVVSQYFQNALREVTSLCPEVKTDFSEVNQFKFIATIYIKGRDVHRCKIWIGGLNSSDAIYFEQGQFSMDNDNSYSEKLSMVGDNQILGFRPPGMWFGTNGHTVENLLTAEQAGEYLWRLFSKVLNSLDEKK